MLLGLLVFVLAVAYDAAYATYVRAASVGHAVRAATASMATYLIGVVGILAVVQVSYWYALPEAAGLWVGTWLGVPDRD